MGQVLDVLSFKILSCGPCFVGTGIVEEEEEDVVGGGDWMLAADHLLGDFGKTVSA